MNTPSAFVASGNAWDRTVKLLFKPFDIGRWFVIGFSAWLAILGKGGASFPDVSKFFDQKNPDFFKEMWALLEKPWVIVLIVGVVTLSLIFGILFCWLRSRGDFMFLHHLYQPNSSIQECWRRAQQHANSLFQWRIVFFVIALGFFAFEGYFIWRQLISPFISANYAWSSVLALPLFIHLVVFIVWVIAINVIILFLQDFAVPIMYWQQCSATSAWTTVLALCNQHPFSVIGYILCMILWSFVGGMIILMILLCTCCTAIIPMILPYISAVALLPYYLFFRAYPVYFLSQWRPDLVPAPAEEAINIVIDVNVAQTPHTIA